MTQREKIIGGIMGFLIIWWLILQISGAKKPAPQAAQRPVPSRTVEKKEDETKEKEAYDLHEVAERIKMKKIPVDMVVTVNPFEEIIPEKPDESPKKTAFSELSLSGIIWEEENPVALINDNVLGAGDTVNGFVVEEVMKDKVMLSKGMEKYILKLMPQPEESSVGANEGGSDNGK